MIILIDTNRIVDFFKGVEETNQIINKSERIYVSFITLGELRAGFLSGKKGFENEKLLIQLLNSPRVEVIYPTEETTHHYARLFSQLRHQGTPIPTNDIWIGALCLQHDLPLYTRDDHFKNIPQLVLL
ncbi:MAG TPA: type II toxin-antitoxin system VapC family toxin [Bdellovibrionota bacterium]|nr:type II toxin-antitoxin system VapC family toxin [Bdellovibrionota bacterium]